MTHGAAYRLRRCTQSRSSVVWTGRALRELTLDTAASIRADCLRGRNAPLRQGGAGTRVATTNAMLGAMPEGDQPRRVATYEDVLQAPDHLVAEIVDGELYTSPRPAPRHARACGVIFGAIEPPFGHSLGGPGGWTILFEPELHLGPDILVPDIAGWRRERLPRLPAEAWFTLAPDWLCEVLSPSTARLDRLKKLRVYARERVTDVWLVDPLQRLVEALRLDGERWTIVGTYGGNDVVRLAPFADIELQLAWLWPEEGA